MTSALNLSAEPIVDRTPAYCTCGQDFATAAAGRFSGSFGGHPRVRYWGVWNEPNLSTFLQPQYRGGRPYSPLLYRADRLTPLEHGTFWLSPTFDPWIADTINRFKETYPGVEVKWEDHQATFQDDLKNSFAAGNAPDVINLSVGEGWVSDYATRDLLLELDSRVSQEVKDSYFEGLWKSQNVDGKNYQFPWYQGISVELINKRIFEKAGLTEADFPKTIDGIPALCKTLKEKAETVCDIRLTVNDLIAQMVYEGNVKPISDDGKTFTFDSPEAVAWLEMYVGLPWIYERTAALIDRLRAGLTDITQVDPVNRHLVRHGFDIGALDLRIVKIVEIVEDRDFVSGGE